MSGWGVTEIESVLDNPQAQRPGNTNQQACPHGAELPIVYMFNLTKILSISPTLTSNQVKILLNSPIAQEEKKSMHLKP